MSQDLLDAGIAAAQAGDLTTASRLLATVVHTDPTCLLGWIWLARVVPEPERQAYCLTRVVALQPDHAEARKRLEALQTATHPVAHSRRQPPVTAAVSLPSAPARSTGPNAPDQTSLKGATRRAGGLIAAGLLGLVFIGLWIGLNHLTPPGSTRTIILRDAPLPPGWTLVAATFTPSTRPNAGLAPAQAEQLRLDAEQFILEMRYSEAVGLLDHLISEAPNDAHAYWLRAQAQSGLAQGDHVLDTYRARTLLVLADMNAAIANGLITGDTLLTRYAVLRDLAYLQTTRADFDVYQMGALVDLHRAVALGNGDPESPAQEPIVLTSLGRCAEGLALAEHLIQAQAGRTTATLDYGRAVSALCLGDLNAALAHIETARALEDSWDREYTHAIILYERGELEAARQVLDRSIADEPSYAGHRYFLRALIYLDQGHPELAAADLARGEGQVWLHIGPYLVVQGRLALARGETEPGWALIQQAEASLERRFPRLRQRLLDDLAGAGYPPLASEPTVVFQPPEPASWPVLPALPEGRQAPLNAGLGIDLADGAGLLALPPGMTRAYHSLSEQPLPTGPVRLLILSVDALSPESCSALSFQVWDQVRGGWLAAEPTAQGMFALADADAFASPFGDVYFRISNRGAAECQMGGFGVALRIAPNDGPEQTVGYAP